MAKLVKGDTRFYRMLQAVRKALASPALRWTVRTVWGVSVAVFVIHHFWYNWTLFRDYDWKIDPRWLLVAIVWALVRRLLGGVRWCLIVLYGHEQYAWKEVFGHLRIYFRSNLARYMPGSLWYAVDRISSAKNRGTSTLRTSLGLIYEMVTMVWSGCLVSIYAAVTMFPIHPSLLSILITLVIILSLLMLHPRVVNPLLHYVLRVLRKPSTEIGLTFRWLAQMWLVSMAIWVVGGMSQFYLAKSLNPSLSLSHLAGITSVTALAWTVGFLAPWAPSGLGVRDGLLVWMLEVYMPTQLAIVVTIVSRLVTVFEDLAWAFLAITLLRKY